MFFFQGKKFKTLSLIQKQETGLTN